MASSEKQSAFTNRQEVIAAFLPLEFADLANGSNLIADIPANSVVTGGWVYTDVAFDAGTTITITLNDSAGNVVDILSGALAVDGVGKDDLVPTGAAPTVSPNIDVNLNQAVTAGKGYLYIEYITKGRAEFSQG